MTIDGIAQDVTRELTETKEGKKRVCEMDRLIRLLDATNLRAAKRRLHARPGISFSVNTTRARHTRPTMSVRASGVDCGVLSFDRAVWMFKPSDNFKHHWESDGLALAEWRARKVREFIKACAVHKKDPRPESRIQDLLFRQMYGGGRRKTGSLRDLQPVLFGGVPIQIPSPVTPRGVSGKRGNQLGHCDVVARGEPGQLVVFEIKSPAASPTECVGALEQAVRYAAALEDLMNRDEHRAAYWRLLGSRRALRHAPRFSAFAFLGEKGGRECDRDLRDKVAALLARNSRKYCLSIMLYREVEDDIEVKPFDERFFGPLGTAEAEGRLRTPSDDRDDRNRKDTPHGER